MISPKVAILMCTYNGEDFLSGQIDSLKSQTHENWDIYVSDDGSKDKTLARLAEYFDEKTPHRLKVFKGPQQGFAANFLSLLSNTEIEADYFALADQDDVWKNEKLERAIECLARIPKQTPALYVSRVELIDEAGKHLGYSPLYTKTPSFGNALVQNIAGGHAMVINQAARDILAKAGGVDVPFHDWWIYQVISGVGGEVVYDPRPMVAYRQHLSNQVGLNTGWRARISRLNKLFKGSYAEFHSRNNRALESIGAVLTPENLRILQAFEDCKRRAVFSRIKGMGGLGLYCQTPAKAASFWLSVLLGKV